VASARARGGGGGAAGGRAGRRGGEGRLSHAAAVEPRRRQPPQLHRRPSHRLPRSPLPQRRLRVVTRRSFSSAAAARPRECGGGVSGIVQGRRVCVSAADCCRCLRRDPPPRRRAAAACARRRLVDDSSRARRAAQRAARLWSESSRVEITKSANFEVARESLEMVPRRSPGAGASRLSREGPVLPRSRAAGARAQLCRLTG